MANYSFIGLSFLWLQNNVKIVLRGNCFAKKKFSINVLFFCYLFFILCFFLTLFCFVFHHGVSCLFWNEKWFFRYYCCCCYCWILLLYFWIHFRKIHYSSFEIPYLLLTSEHTADTQNKGCHVKFDTFIDFKSSYWLYVDRVHKVNRQINWERNRDKDLYFWYFDPKKTTITSPHTKF